MKVRIQVQAAVSAGKTEELDRLFTTAISGAFTTAEQEPEEGTDQVLYDQDTLKEELEEVFNELYTRAESRDTFLHLAARRGDVAMMQKLTEIERRNPEVDLIPSLAARPNETGDTILHAAIDSGSIDAVVHVMQMFPELLHKENEAGQSPLDRALEKAGHGGEAAHLFERMGLILSETPGALQAYFTEQQESFKGPLRQQFAMKKPLQGEGTEPDFGQTEEAGMQLAMAEKRERREQKGSGLYSVVLPKDHFPEFVRTLKEFATTYPDKELQVEFAQGLGKGAHWIGGQASLKDGHLQVTFFDSLADIKYVKPHVEAIRAAFPDAEIAMNFDKIQSGVAPACAVMTLQHLFHASNQPAFMAEPSLHDYMKTHPATRADVQQIRDREKPDKKANVSDVLENTLREAEALGITVGKLPLRLVRDMESLTRISFREQGNPEVALPAKAFSAPQTFKESLNEHLVMSDERSFNARTPFVYRHMRDRVNGYLDRHSTEEIQASMQRHTLEGFTQWAHAYGQGKIEAPSHVECTRRQLGAGAALAV